MKKLLIVMLAVACCIAFSAPAFAEIKVGGMVSADTFWWQVSKERRQATGVIDGAAPNGVGSYSSTEFGMGQPWNRLNLQYISDDKKVGGFIELRTGGQRAGGNSVVVAGPNGSGYANPTGEQNFDWELAYIDYHFNPKFYLRVGRQTQTFAIYTPEQQMGHNIGHIVLNGFGNIHGAVSRDGIRAYIKFNDMVRMELQALNPDSDGTATAAPGGRGNPGNLGELINPAGGRSNPGGTAGALPALPGVAGGTVAESNTIPRFDVSIPIKFGNFNVEPSFSWARSHYTEVLAGSDNQYETWGAAVGFMWGMGPFKWSGEYTYGVNLGGHSYGGAANAAPSTFTRSLTGPQVGITNTYSHNGWTQLEFNFGPFGIQGIFGMVNDKNDGNPAVSGIADATEWDITRKAYGLQFPIYLAKNFKVVPQVWYFDYDRKANIGGRAVGADQASTDLGTEVMAGIFWQLTF